MSGSLITLSLLVTLSLGQLQSYAQETSTSETMTMSTTMTTSGTMTTSEIMTTSETVPPCSCPSLFVTAPASKRDIVGMYALHSCQYAGKDVYVNADLTTYLFYNDVSSKWVFAPLLDPAASSSIESVSTADKPSDISWKIYEDSVWKSVDTVKVECACDRPTCKVLIMNSTDIAHTFKGTFTLTNSTDVRPVYYNSEEDLYLYFHSSGICHFWAISDSLTSSKWVMYSYDISPRPDTVQAEWKVYRSDRWTDDDSLRVVCLIL